MSSILLILTSWSGFVEGVTAISDALYELCNRLAGRSWLLDNLIALPLNNQLFKAALLGGCFLAVWHGHRDDATIRRNRRILLVTLLASAFVIVTTQTLSRTILLPRPFIQSQTTFHLQNGQMVESRRLTYRVPLDAGSRKTYHALLKGEVVQNDLGSFPSDHAAFYVTLAVGILLASRALGWLAVSWTFLVLLGSRIVAGQHTPLDVVAGAGIGVAMLLLFQLIFARRLRPLTEPIVDWTLRHQAAATVLVSMVVFEAVNTLQDLRPLFEICASVAARVL